MHPRLEELFAYAAETRAELHASIAGATEAELARRPATGAWSAAEHLEHLALVESGSARLTARMFANAREAGLGPERETSSLLGSLDRFALEDPDHRIEAPAIVAPQGTMPPAESLAQLESARRSILDVFREGDGLDLSTIRLRHAAIGEIDLYQWLLFLGQHERRHARHIVRTLRAVRPERPSRE